jgi:hypothetical protein
MTQQDILAFLKQTEEVCSKATKGEWSLNRDGIDVDEPYYIIMGVNTNEEIYFNNQHDAKFIITARTALPLALEIIKEQGELIRKLADRIAELEKEKDK